jgi:hypothetical protein
LRELEEIAAKSDNVFLALVCVEGKEICCLPYDQLLGLISLRQKETGEAEEQYTVIASLNKGKQFRVYVNAPNRRKTMLGKPLLISRSDFPDKLFE